MQFQFKVFHPGKKVIYNGYTYTVDYVVVSSYDLRVQLREIDQQVNADHLEVEPTIFVIDRK